MGKITNNQELIETWRAELRSRKPTISDAEAHEFWVALEEMQATGFMDWLSEQGLELRRVHFSYCALHNAPAETPGPCDCGSDAAGDLLKKGEGNG